MIEEFARPRSIADRPGEEGGGGKYQDGDEGVEGGLGGGGLEMAICIEFRPTRIHPAASNGNDQVEMRGKGKKKMRRMERKREGEEEEEVEVEGRWKGEEKKKRERERERERGRIETTERNDFRIRSSESVHSASMTNKALTNSAEFN